MKILTIGGGAREHAAVSALARANAEIYAVMKNVNPGIEKKAVKTLICSESDTDRICDFAINNFVEYAFVGPEVPLSIGIVDALQTLGIKCASPTKAAARIETDKSFMRELVAKHSIDGNLGFKSFDDAVSAIEYVKTVPYKVAVKPVGLTGGKGVKIQGNQLKDLQDTIDYINEIFDRAGDGKVIIEELAEGEEFTQMVFTDGTDVIPMPLVQDHKRAYEGDRGPNTGGMGSYADANHLLPFVTAEERQRAIDIDKAIIDALRREGCLYRGTMYGQFMLTKDGPKIIEINARFGDPEAMNVLTVLTSDFSEIIRWMAGGGRIKDEVTFANKATVCKYIVPRGYGVKPEPGHTISLDLETIDREGAIAYFGSIDKNGDKYVTGTSRSIGIVGIGDTLAEAERNCENGLAHVKCDAMEIRHDIGTAALIQRRIDHMRSIRSQ